VSAGRLGTPFSVDTLKNFRRILGILLSLPIIHSYPLRFFMTENDSSKVAVVDSEACKAPLMKEKLPDEEDANHCFVYDLSRDHGRWYLDGSCIELPFS
jgi:hypothetical protein